MAPNGSSNLAIGRPATQSSVLPGHSRAGSPDEDARGAVNGAVSGGFGFHTGEEDNPWWQVDLGAAHLLSEIVVHNRMDDPALRDRALPLEIWISDDGLSFRLAHVRHERFGGSDGQPLRWSPDGRQLGRFVRLTVARRTCLHLDEVEVHGRVWDPVGDEVAAGGIGYASSLGREDASWTISPLAHEIAPVDFLRPTGAGLADGSLRRRFERIGALEEAASVLSWDQSAMMPEGGAAARGEQLAALAGLSHELLVAPVVATELSLAEAGGADAEGDPEGWRERNLALMRHAHRRACALPPDLVEERARLQTSCEMTWRSARADGDFARVSGPMRALLGVVREEARLLGASLGLSPYDALLDGHQPGMGAAEIEPIFDRYEGFLRDLLPAVEARQARGPAPIKLPTPVPADIQERVCRRLAEAAGLDWSNARLDRSLHPFCGGTPDDVRITTRYDPNEPSRAMLGVLHETGHALYQRGLPAAWRRQPVGEAAGMAVHESQSLIVEMQACRSDAYLSWLGPLLAGAYGGDAEAYAPDNLARLWRRVERSLIRVDADEVTYPAHVILRFRLERALIEGSLEVDDLPAAWSDGLFALLGIRPDGDRTGCLQDIHWFMGLYGYFPSYSLGAMAAAQLMQAARLDLRSLDAELARGDLSNLVGWLGSRVHAEGRRLPMNRLLERATGRTLDPGAFEDHLRARYLAAN